MALRWLPRWLCHHKTEQRHLERRWRRLHQQLVLVHRRSRPPRTAQHHRRLTLPLPHRARCRTLLKAKQAWSPRIGQSAIRRQIRRASHDQRSVMTLRPLPLSNPSVCSQWTRREGCWIRTPVLRLGPQRCTTLQIHPTTTAVQMGFRPRYRGTTYHRAAQHPRNPRHRKSRRVDGRFRFLRLST